MKKKALKVLLAQQAHCRASHAFVWSIREDCATKSSQRKQSKPDSNEAYWTSLANKSESLPALEG